MISRRHSSYRSDPNFVVRPLRRSSLVHAPPLPPLPTALHTWLAERQLLASRDGRDVAEVVRGAGSGLLVLHSDAAVSSQPFDDDVQLLHVGPASLRLWGRRGGACGVWKVTAQGTRFVAPLAGVSRIVQTPLGAVPVYDEGDAKRYVSGDRLVTVSEACDLFFGEDGTVRTVCPLYLTKRGRVWTVLGEPDLRTDASYLDEGGNTTRLLPFVADRVRQFHRAGFLVRQDGRGAVCVLVAGVPRVSEYRDLRLIWMSAGNEIAMLVGQPARASRRLIVGGTVAFEGRFFMRRDGLRWSPDGLQFVAHLTLLDQAGDQGEEMLVTRDGSTVIPKCSSAHEPAVDDRGGLAYVYADQSGRRIVVDGVATEAFPYVWNLSAADGMVTANALVHGQIHRVELIRGR